MRESLWIRPGTTVDASDGRLGTVEEVIVHPGTGELAYLVVRRGWSDRLLHVGAEHVLLNGAGGDGDGSAGGTVRLDVTREEAERLSAGVATAGGTGEALGLQEGDRLRIPVLEERLSAETRLVDMGELRIHKRVETEEASVVQEVTRDDVVVERIPINRPLEAPATNRVEGDWIVVPVMEEVLVVHKQLMLKEELHIRRRQVTAPEEVRETLRRERVELEDASRHGVSGESAATGATGAPDVPAQAPLRRGQ